MIDDPKDPEASPYPHVEFYEADRVEYIHKNGRITGIRFGRLTGKTPGIPAL